MPTWPTTRIPTERFDAQTDAPDRAAVYNLIGLINAVLDARGAAAGDGLASLVDGEIPDSQMKRGEPNGVADLDGTGKVPATRLPQGSTWEYQWNGTRLRIRRGDGTWGPYVDLRGPAGPQGLRGLQGVPGPAIAPTIEVRGGGRHDRDFRVGISGQWSGWVRLESGSCFPPGQKILAADGRWVPVEAVRLGDLLAAPGWSEGRPVIALDDGGVALEVAEISTTSGTLRVTPNHPVRVQSDDGWVWAALRPNRQSADRLFWPTVLVEDQHGASPRREMWRRGQRVDIRPLRIGDRLVMMSHQDPRPPYDGLGGQSVTGITIRTADSPTAITPVTGGHIIAAPGVVCSGGWDAATESQPPNRVRAFFRASPSS